MKLSIGNIEFNSKKQAKEYIGELKSNYQDGQKLNNDDFMFMCEVLKRHPWSEQKIGCGIKYFYVDYTKYRTKCFHIERLDGTKTDFSYLECITPSISYKKDFIKACRSAISDQILEVKNNYESGIKKCNKCGCNISYNTCEVDHYPIMFKDILNEFLEKYPKLDFKKITDLEDWDNLEGVKITDDKILKDWQNHHRQEATYRFLCSDCNRHW